MRYSSQPVDAFEASSAETLRQLLIGGETREETEARLKREWNEDCQRRMDAVWAEMEAEAMEGQG